MGIKQLSIFVANEKGTLADVTRIFREHEIDIRAISVYDTVDYGILRTVVSEPEKAVEALAKEGIVSKLSDILTINPEDKRGSLNDIFTLLGDNDINIDYIYSFLVREDGSQLFVLKVNDKEKAQELLEKNGVEIIREL
ncbi:MAG: ACT domain-containing protein [Peptostreptococcaceae bacterium]|nr:ACT domain-containing protein [Peptostreptococcaceae bacterium]